MGGIIRFGITTGAFEFGFGAAEFDGIIELAFALWTLLASPMCIAVLFASIFSVMKIRGGQKLYFWFISF